MPSLFLSYLQNQLCALAIHTIAKHLIDILPDPDWISIVFPYTGCLVTSTSLTQSIMERFPEQCSKILQSVDSVDRTALHIACDSGNKQAVITLLSALQQCDILKTETLRRDKSGRTALSMARAEQKREWYVDKRWNSKKERFEVLHADWKLVECNESYQARQETACAMLAWIQHIAPDKVDEIHRR